MSRTGFTLVEVTLAMSIMAVGTLGLIALYSFGYRENQQSLEDVEAVAVAQMNVNAMVAALSSTNMTWSAWKSIGIQPSEGWGKYAGDGTGATATKDDGASTATPLSDPNSVAQTVFSRVMSAAGKGASFDAQDLYVAIVVAPDDADCPRRYSVALRCGRRAATLLYQPLYYTEVAFQGLKE